MEKLFERWVRATEEAVSLLDRNDALHRERMRLFHKRAELMREIVRLGRNFCEDMPSSGFDAETDGGDEGVQVEGLRHDMTDVAEALPGRFSR
jgi:hypothetical protein